MELLKDYKKRLPSLKLSEVGSLGGRKTYCERKGIVQFQSMHLYYALKDSLILANLFEEFKSAGFKEARALERFDELSSQSFLRQSL